MAGRSGRCPRKESEHRILTWALSDWQAPEAVENLQPHLDTSSLLADEVPQLIPLRLERLLVFGVTFQAS